MSNLRATDMLLLEDIFEMHSGYVLNFSDRTFSAFFADELGIDIDQPKFSQNGGSKGRRFRTFIQTVDKATAALSLNALWEYREALRHRAGEVEKVGDAAPRLAALIQGLGGKPTFQAQSSPQQGASPQATIIDPAKLAQLKSDLIALSPLAPQQRGFAFERFLKVLFDAYGLNAQEPFRNRGEQIDGSFQLGHETYLVEAKWQGNPTGVADLHNFHGKIEQKAAWTRGLFVSNSGFSADGLLAFGRGKRVICMDGFDLYETLDRAIPISDVLDRKVRRAAETGEPFASVRDLFPN